MGKALLLMRKFGAIASLCGLCALAGLVCADAWGRMLPACAMLMGWISGACGGAALACAIVMGKRRRGDEQE